MGKSGFDVSGLKKFQKELEKLKDKAEPFAEECTKDLGAILLGEVIKRTPTGIYNGSTYTCESGVAHKSSRQPGDVGGTLRRGWTTAPIARTHKNGNIKVVVYNPVEYASYVEYGHRIRGGKGVVKGHFMLEKSRQEVEKIIPKIVEGKLNKFLGGAFE